MLYLIEVIYLNFSWFVGPDIQLQDCLAAFFTHDELKGGILNTMFYVHKCSKK